LDLLQDLRFAWRILLKARGFTALAVTVLGLGIGANTAVFSILSGTLLRPPPYRDPQRLVDILDESPREARLRMLFSSVADFREYQQHSTLLESIGAVTWAVPMPVLTGRGPARQVTTIPASESFFQVLGVTPEIGRAFTAADGAGGCTVVLANRFWKEVFGGDPGAVGQSITLDEKACTVVGVMGAGFSFYPRDAQLWRVMTPDVAGGSSLRGLFIVGRLRPGVTRERLQAELAGIHSGIQTTGLEREYRPAVDSLQDDFLWVAGRNLRTTIWALTVAVGLVLLIACLNVANLLLGRAVARHRELAVRAALGAGHGRLLRQLLTEALLLAGAGGAVGIGVAYAALRYFRQANPVELPVGSEVRLDIPVLLFTAAVSVATALIFGLAPAWRWAGRDLTEALKSGGRGVARGGSRAARLLVMAQVAFSVALLAGAGLLIESVNRMATAHFGFRTQHVYATRLILPQRRYPDDPPRRRFYEALEQRLAVQPGLMDAALGNAAPPFTVANSAIEVEGRPFHPERAVHDVGHEAVTLNYFRTLGMTLVRGRGFDGRDGPDQEQVTVVDEALAREYFPDGDPLGQRIRIQGQTEPFPWVKIVGVVASAKRRTVYREMGWVESPTMYRPMTQHTPNSVSIVLRTAGSAAPIAAEVRRTVAEIDSEAAVGEIEPLERRIAQVMTYPRFRAVVFGAFAGFALLLAAAGLYGVLSQMVAQRRQEIGVRMALGAQPAQVLRLVLVAGGVPVVSGLMLGLAGAVVLGRWGEALLYGVSPADPLTMAAVALVLAASAAVAIALPARRAATTNPIEALRAE
jgi:putative ABC transport system permease protein